MAADDNKEAAATLDTTPRDDEKTPTTHTEGLEASTTDASDVVTDDKQPLDANEAEKQDTSDAPSDDNIIFWDGDDDPANPYNWPSWLKVVNCVLVSSLTFLTPLGSCKSAH